MTEFTLDEVGLALLSLTVLVLGAATLRRRIPGLRSLFIPNAITAGVFALLVGPQVLGNLRDSGRWSEGLWGAATIDVWTQLPGLLINVVFASILLGKQLPSLGTIMETIERLGELDNTVVVVTSDHGFWYGEGLRRVRKSCSLRNR